MQLSACGGQVSGWPGIYWEHFDENKEHNWIGWLLLTVLTKEKDSDELRALNSQIKVYIRNLKASRLAL